MANCEMPTVLWSLVALLLADIGWAIDTIAGVRARVDRRRRGFGMLIRGNTPCVGRAVLPLVYLLVHRPEPVDGAA